MAKLTLNVDTKLLQDELNKMAKKIKDGLALSVPAFTKATLAASQSMEELSEALKKPVYVDPKGLLTTGVGMDFGSDSISTSYAVQMADKMIVLDSLSQLQGSKPAFMLKILKSHNVPKGQAYIVNTDFLTAPGPILFDNQDESAKIQSLPKKGLEVSDLKIYRFGKTTDDVAGDEPAYVLGGKGANLAEMARMGLPVPPGFTIPAHLSVTFNSFHASKNEPMEGMLLSTLMAKVIEADKGLLAEFGYQPLLSVRSGARVSMPGMMDTILNVGITDGNIEEWKTRLGAAAALDCYRRFLQMYGATAMGIEPHEFEDALAEIRAAAKVTKDSELSASYLARVVKRFKDIFEANGKKVPELREEAIKHSIIAVFESWNNARAIDYRKVEGIPDDWGTAVTLQAMVFGNMNERSCSGVAFSRNKATGENKPQGDFMVMAQGEDVVAALAPTLPLEKLQKAFKGAAVIHHAVQVCMYQLEKHFKDMQDIEFTVQDGKLWLLQTRTGKRSALAAFQIAYDMFNEGLITKQEAMARVGKKELLHLMSPQIDPVFKGNPIAIGLGVGGGIATGVVCLTSERAIACKKVGQKAILVRKETSPDDFAGIMASVGILTATGGTTSHAAVVANGFNKTCIVGCTGLQISIFSHSVQFKSTVVEEGELISIDGASGIVWPGEVPVIAPVMSTVMLEVCKWFMDGDTADRITPEAPDHLIMALEAVQGDTVYVDTCLMPLDADLSWLGDSILKCKAKTVVFDLSYVDSLYCEHDKCLNKMFGYDPMLGKGNKRANNLLSMSKEAAAKCLLKLPGSCSLGEKLRARGFKVIGPVRTVADLLVSDGAMTIDEETITQVFGSKEALLWVQDAMGKAGKVPAKPLPRPAYWYEAIMRKGA